MQTHPPPAATDEPHADVLARAERWARGGRVAEAQADCEALLPRLVARNDRAALARLEHVMALIHLYGGRVADAVLAGYRATEYLEGSADIARQLQVLALQACALARLGATAEAIELLDRAAALLPRLGDSPRERCVFWTNAAAVHHALGQFAQALDSARQAQALAAGLDDADLEIVCRGNVLSLEVERLAHAPTPARADLAPALAALETFLDDCVAAGRRHLLPVAVASAADGWLLLGEAERARNCLLRGVDAAQALAARPAQARLELRLARLDRLAGAFDAAAAHLARALEGLAEGQSQHDLAAAHLEHSELMEARQDWRRALESFKRHAALHETAVRSQADARAQVLAMRRDIERSRTEAALLRRRNEELQHSMTQLSDEAGKFRRQAMEDPLTGLANRRQLEAGVAQLGRRWPDVPLMLLIVDVDHFKRINDNWSHAAGDEVLKTFAALLRAQSRPHDVLARIGGEEFVVALGGAVSTTRALLVAERLRATIEGHDWSALQPGMRVTASIGVSARAPGEALAVALERADKALYECKRGGRNQVRCAA